MSIFESILRGRVKRHQPRSKRDNGQSGSALIEFSMILPVILLVGFVAVEVSNILRTRQEIQRFGREASVFVYNKCKRPTTLRTNDPQSSKAAWHACINQAIQEVTYASVQAMTGLEIGAQFWVVNPRQDAELGLYFPQNNIGIAGPQAPELYASAANWVNFTPTFTAASFDQNAALNQLRQIKHYFFVVQVSAQYKAVLPFVSRLIGYDDDTRFSAVGIV